MNRGDVVLVRFPHPSGQRGKKRPAIVDPDHPPKDGFYLQCKVLNVLTRQADGKPGLTAR